MTRKQLWKCVICFHIRQWGFGKPKDAILMPILSCTNCQRSSEIVATPHSYFGGAWDHLSKQDKPTSEALGGLV